MAGKYLDSAGAAAQPLDGLATQPSRIAWPSDDDRGVGATLPDLSPSTPVIHRPRT